jgi:L,D-transpeptidase ErfK/SrfK
MRIRPPRSGRAALLAAALLGARPALADARPQPRAVYGIERTTEVEPGEALLDVAWRHRLGFHAVRRLNPEVDVWIPEPGTPVRLPTRMILPDVEPAHLVINIPEMRLYDFRPDAGPDVFAVAVGGRDIPTPVGRFLISDREIDPIWDVPPRIRRERPQLPAQVPAGPDNPLGSRWMRLGQTLYGLHGTDTRWAIGRMATSGCIRLYDDQIQQLFERTPSGTPVRIVYQPYKWGVEGQVIYFEAHPDLYGRVADPEAEALRVAETLGWLPYVDVEAVRQAVQEVRGVPIRVGTLPDDGVTSPRTVRR